MLIMRRPVGDGKPKPAARRPQNRNYALRSTATEAPYGETRRKYFAEPITALVYGLVAPIILLYAPVTTVEAVSENAGSVQLRITFVPAFWMLSGMGVTVPKTFPKTLTTSKRIVPPVL